MEVNALERTIFFNELHPLNALSPIFLTEVASVTEERLEQLTNAEFPTLVTPLLITTDVMSFW